MRHMHPAVRAAYRKCRWPTEAMGHPTINTKPGKNPAAVRLILVFDLLPLSPHLESVIVTSSNYDLKGHATLQGATQRASSHPVCLYLRSCLSIYMYVMSLSCFPSI